MLKKRKIRVEYAGCPNGSTEPRKFQYIRRDLTYVDVYLHDLWLS